jgi:hypothetical protein
MMYSAAGGISPKRKRGETKMVKFPIGTKVTVKGKTWMGQPITGTVTSFVEWNNPDGYQGLVYTFKDRQNRTNFGYKESDLEGAQ